MDAADERRRVPEQVEQANALTTEEMLALLTHRESADQAYRITETYEHVERIYNASLSTGTFRAASASTNPR